MQQRLTISHAVPKPSGFMLIALPRIDAYTGDLVKLETPLVQIALADPQTGKQSVAEIHDVLRFNYTDANEAILCSFHAKIAYGINGRQLFNALLKKYPTFNGAIDFLLIRIYEPVIETKA